MRAPAQAAPSHWPAAAATLIPLGNDVATESPPFFRSVASARRNVPVSFGCCVVRSRAGGVLIRMSPAINMSRDAAAEAQRADTRHTFALASLPGCCKQVSIIQIQIYIQIYLSTLGAPIFFLLLEN